MATEVDYRTVQQPSPQVGRIPPRTPSRPLHPSRRESNDSTVTRPRPMVSLGQTRIPPPLPQRHGSPSVFSGREGSVLPRRGESMTSPPPAELELFAHHCRVFFWNEAGADGSGEYISRTLSRLPPAHRAAYTRVQSQLRAQAHLHHLRVRISSFHALIAANAPNSGLSGPARADLTGHRARAERADRLAHFVHTWGESAGALEPFFRGLWAALRLQSRGDASRGGAGAHRVVWEVNDAVFLESGGPEFMHEAVVIVKGVLGLEEQALSEPPKLRRMDARVRAGSDPFTDAVTPSTVTPRKPSGRQAPPPPPSRRRPTPATRPSPTTPGTATSGDGRWGKDPTVPLLGPTSPNPGTPTSPVLMAPKRSSPAPSEDDDEAEEEADLNRVRFRVWTFPAHITDEEADRLLSLFPRYLQRPDARFPLARRRLKDLELGSSSDPWTTLTVSTPGGDAVQVTVPKVECEDEARVVRSGTGRIWVGSLERDDGWMGGRWFRFKRWWWRLFGRG